MSALPRRNHLLLLVLTLLIPSVVLALDVDTLNALLQRKAPESRAFVETQYRKILKRPIELRGELKFTPPDVFEKHVITPRDQTFRIAGNTVFMATAGKPTQEFSIRSQPILSGLMLGFQAVVAGQLQMLEPHYRLNLVGDEQAWTLTLLPKDAELARHVKQLTVSGHAGILTRIEMLEPSGDHSITTLSDPEF